MDPSHYERLAEREASHWNRAPHDPRNPQIWDDPVLQEIFFGDLERAFRERIVAQGCRVLELGCGEGDLAFELAERGLEVTGIDLSATRIEAARTRARTSEVTPGVHAPAVAPTFVVGDLNTMRLPDGPFDCVVAHDALHHIARLDHVLDEVARVLEPRGALIAIDYLGMTRVARSLAAFFYAVLPTAMPYREKWRLRRRVGSFLASEAEKRAALERGGGGALHEASPFEGISQESILRQVGSRFPRLTVRTLLPFFWYLAPKLRVPAHWRYGMARRFRGWDDQLLRVSRGAYVYLEARR